jgi:hypothetical protein
VGSRIPMPWVLVSKREVIKVLKIKINKMSDDKK